MVMAQRDILAGPAASADIEVPFRARIAAFVPLPIALLGVGGLLVGGVSARHDTRAAAPIVDPIATGSIGSE